MPHISVVLPVYNGGETLAAALASISSQTLESWECIAVDDGSDDNTLQILTDEAVRDSRIIPVRIPRSGIVDALNTGIGRAQAPFIARMDADDISLPQRLEKQYNHLQNNPGTGLVSCLAGYGGDAAVQAGYARYVRWINTLISHDQIYLNRFVESPLAHPSVMFRRDLAGKHGAYRNGNFPEDYELWLRWLEAGVKMEKVPEVLLEWNDPENRLSRTDPRYSFMAFYEIKSAYLCRWLEAHNPHHPDVVVWGAGRTTRKRVELLQKTGIRVIRYIDIDPDKKGTVIQGIPVFMPEGLPEPKNCFVLSYVGSAGARDLIGEELAGRGFTIGRSWIPVA